MAPRARWYLFPQSKRCEKLSGEEEIITSSNALVTYQPLLGVTAQGRLLNIERWGAVSYLVLEVLVRVIEAKHMHTPGGGIGGFDGITKDISRLTRCSESHTTRLLQLWIRPDGFLRLVGPSRPQDSRIME